VNDNQASVPPDVQPSQQGRIRGLHRRLHAHPVLAMTTKVVVTALGVLVLVGGLVMIVTPGPGIVGIVLGLAILATEYAWADRWLQTARRKARDAKERAGAMDPSVRRQRLVVGALVLGFVAFAVSGYVAVFDWPPLAVHGWNEVQHLGRWVPELPGM
jgi:uncharacterized protein (TIGR02611 family)